MLEIRYIGKDGNRRINGMALKTGQLVTLPDPDAAALLEASEFELAETKKTKKRATKTTKKSRG